MLIRGPGESTWRAPAVTAYENEAAIQALLTQSPELMPGSEGQRFAVATEATVQAGYADIIAVTPSGDITLIGCKLRKNPEIRREVVGQILAYAATMWELDYPEFDRIFTSRTGRALAEAVAAVSDASWDEEHFRGAVADNLLAGRFRLVIAVDEITEELRRIVRFLNAHTTPELDVLALELRYVADSGVEILFPTLYGEESAAAKPGARTQPWDEERFLATIGPMMSTTGNVAARRLYTFAQERGATPIWGKSAYPSVTMRFSIAGKMVNVFNLAQWAKPDNWSKVGPKLFVLFGQLVGKVSDETLARLASDLREAPATHDALRGLETGGFKGQAPIPLDDLSPEDVARIEGAFARLLSA